MNNKNKKAIKIFGKKNSEEKQSGEKSIPKIREPENKPKAEVSRQAVFNLYSRILIYLFSVFLLFPLLQNFLARFFGGFKYSLNFSRNSIVFFVVAVIFIYIKRESLEKIASNILDKGFFKKNHLVQGLFFFNTAFFFVAMNFFIKTSLKVSYIDFFLAIVFLDFLTYLLFAGVYSFFVFGEKFINSFFKEFRNSLIVVFFFSFIFFNLSFIFDSLWRKLSYFVSITAHFFLSIFTDETYTYMSSGVPIISFREFYVVVGQPCSGTESSLLFILIFFIFCIFNSEQLSTFLEKRKTGKTILLALFFIIGFVLTFMVNALRVILIMVIGQKNPAFASTLFHENIGWILTIIFYLIFFFLLDKFINKNKDAKKNKKQ